MQENNTNFNQDLNNLNNLYNSNTASSVMHDDNGAPKSNKMFWMWSLIIFLVLFLVLLFINGASVYNNNLFIG
jgi:uncharacterized integral membrane protein